LALAAAVGAPNEVKDALFEANPDAIDIVGMEPCDVLQYGTRAVVSMLATNPQVRE
jgi:hypothetical protein